MSRPAPQNPTRYQPRCDRAHTLDDASYCESRKATQAAEEQAKWALGQLIVGALGVLAVVVTLLYTAKAAIAAEAAAEAAREVIDQTRNTAAIELRAYVHAKQIEFVPRRVVAGGAISWWDARIVWHNSGATPARHVIGGVVWRRFGRREDIPDNFDYPDISSDKVPTTIGPNQLMWVVSPIPVEALEEVHAQRSVILLWSWINYLDAFGKEERRTEGCWCITGCGAPSRDDSAFQTMHFGPFNGIDQDCYRPPKTNQNS